jgi:hypothetical protein
VCGGGRGGGGEREREREREREICPNSKNKKKHIFYINSPIFTHEISEFFLKKIVKNQKLKREEMPIGSDDCINIYILEPIGSSPTRRIRNFLIIYIKIYIRNLYFYWLKMFKTFKDKIIIYNNII